MAEIKLAELETSMKSWAKDMFAEWQKQQPVAGDKTTAGDKTAVAAQDPVTVQAKVDGQPVKAELVKPETKANMGAMGIAGIVESGDHFKILRFELGPITSALVGIPLGAVGSRAIGAWLPPYRDANGVMTSVRPASIGLREVNWLNPAAHVGGMVLVETYGANFLGRTAAHFIAGTLLISTLLNYTPLGAWLDRLVTAISPKVTVGQNRGLNAGQVSALRQRHLQEQSAQNGHGRMTLSPF